MDISQMINVASQITAEMMIILINGIMTTDKLFGKKDKIRAIAHKIHKNKFREPKRKKNEIVQL